MKKNNDSNISEKNKDVCCEKHEHHHKHKDHCSCGHDHEAHCGCGHEHHHEHDDHCGCGHDHHHEHEHEDHCGWVTITIITKMAVAADVVAVANMERKMKKFLL